MKRKAVVYARGGEDVVSAACSLWGAEALALEDYACLDAKGADYIVLADRVVATDVSIALKKMEGDPFCAGFCWNGSLDAFESDELTPGYVVLDASVLSGAEIATWGETLYGLRRSGWRFFQGGVEGVFTGDAGECKNCQIDPEAIRSRYSDDFELGYCDRPLGADSKRPLRFVSSRKPELRREIVARRKERVKISFCMIARDESPHIFECVRSVAPFADELLVGDTGSTDDTKALAEKAGATVLDVPWNDHFADARNAVIEKAKNPWIFWMDADDVLPWDTGEAMLLWAEKAPPDMAGASMVVRFVKEGAGEKQFVHHVKLFRNLPGVCFKGRIHESPLDSIVEHGSIDRLRYDSGDGAGPRDAEIWHKNYDTSEEGQMKKNERNVRLLWKAISENPEDGFAWYNMGMQRGWQNDYQGAEPFYRKALELGVCEGIDAKAATGIGLAAYYSGRFEDAIEWSNKALGINPFWPDPYMLRAEAQNALGLTSEAIQSLSLAFAYPQGSGWFGGKEGSVGAHAALKLTDSLEALGRFGEAVYWARQAVGMNQETATLQRALRLEARLVQSADRLKSALGTIEAY